MTIEAVGHSATQESETSHGARVVVCGSFRRQPEVLRADFAGLAGAGCEIVSPRDVDFVAEIDGFVLAAHELDKPPQEIEAAHLAALEASDFVWLHAPNGYVGTSAALELGVAHALGIPIYCRTAPAEVALAGLATEVADPYAAAELVRSAGKHIPARPLRLLQSYYEVVATERGFERETAQDTLLLLLEEVGELARAVRRSIGLSRAHAYEGTDMAAELADVQLYVLHLANVLDLDLATAVVSKERLNAARHTLTPVAKAA